MPPFRSSRLRNAVAFALFSVVFCWCASLPAQPRASPQKAEAKSKSSTALGGIPLPIGQEAKGLVLPDIDPDGHLRAKFEAGTAKRIDADHIEMKALKMTTFTPQNTTDLLIDMPLSTMDLTTRVITSHARTTVSRADFNIAGDAMRFDTIARKGNLVGNVKMVISAQSPLTKKAGP